MTKVDPFAVLRAEIQGLKLEKIRTLRFLEHQRIILAICVRRLGGMVAIEDAAIARAAERWTVELGQRKGLTLPSADSTEFTPPDDGPLVFRLVDKDTGEDVRVPARLPQCILDLVSAVRSGPVTEDVQKALDGLEGFLVEEVP